MFVELLFAEKSPTVVLAEQITDNSSITLGE